MKQKDVAMIIMVAVLSGMVSYFACDKLIPNTKPKVEKAEKVDAIVATFNVPDQTYFNGQSINPTQLIQIGKDPDNTNPFANQ